MGKLALMYFSYPAVLMSYLMSWTLNSSSCLHSVCNSPSWWSDSFIKSRQIWRKDREKTMMRRLSQWVVWWTEKGLLLVIVKRAHKQSSHRLLLPWGTDVACYCVNWVCMWVCVCILFKHVFACMHLNHKWRLESQVIKAELCISYQIWIAFTFDHISFLPTFPSLPSPLLLRVLPWQRQGALRLAASVSFPEPWFCCWNCQSASQICRWGGRDCVNIFWLAKMEGHLGEGGRGETIGRKYDVSKWRAWKKMLHLLEYTLQSFLLCPKLESKD